MGLLNDILKWSATLPSWQRDAARRLFQKEEGLSDEDYNELYALFKEEHGLQEACTPEVEPLARHHIPAEPNIGEKVILKAIRELKNVNCIPSEQELNIREDGITIVYGGNGSGKSGYARVLKHACRARDHSEGVHPNANDPSASNSIPTAKIEVECNGKTERVCWLRDEAPPEKLSTVSVFDARCARSYITSEQDVAFLPYGLDILENLANKVFPKVRGRLDDEIAGINTDKSHLDHLKGDTEVGETIDKLGPRSDPSKIKSLGTFTQDEANRLSELNEALSEADPKKKAHELRLSASRLKALGERIAKSLDWVNNKAVENLKSLIKAKRASDAAESKAAEMLRAGEELLPGTGGEAWKLMFEAARKFSTEEACPTQEFPCTGENHLCPLCQQPLQTEAVKYRMRRFDQYVKNDIAKTAEESRQKLNFAIDSLKDADLGIGFDNSIKEEISFLDKTLPPIVEAFESSLEERRQSILEALSSQDWDIITELEENPRHRIRSLAARQLQSARMFSRAASQDRKKGLLSEREELKARNDLSKNLEAVLALLERMKKKAALERCRKQLKTRPISDKSKELSNVVVTKNLKEALDSELKGVGVSHIKTKLKERNERGRTLYQLLLDLPTKINRINEILSEGEQRAIAIAAFLAELSLADHSCGIVLDDPVSSLDHWRRKNVARRLVEEASRRQVIVFTHDTTFLGQLCDEIDERGTPYSMMYLEWRGYCPGYVCDGLPWDHQGYKARIDALEKEQRKLAKSWQPYPGDEDSNSMRIQYDRLRATLEQVIQDVVFNGVVKRYRDWIRVDALSGVVGFEHAEYEAINRLHKRCCDVVSAHDHASAKNDPVPEPDDLKADIEALKQVVETIKQRRKK